VARYRRSECIDMDMLSLAAAACCYMGRISAQLISVEKDWKHVPLQKVVTLNTCCDTACLTFQLPHTTTGSFQSHEMTTNWLFSEPPMFESMQQTFSQMKKFCNSQISVVTFLPRDAKHARTSHGPVSVCLCLCLCLSQVGVLLKRLQVRSHKQHHTIAHGL